MKKVLFIMAAVLTLVSCGSTKQLTQEEIRTMTTHQYNAGYDQVFSATMSLLQSEGFMITNTDKSTGLINGNREVHNSKSGWGLVLLGTATTSTHAKISIFIEEITPELTEVSMSLYEGHTDTSIDGYLHRSQSTFNKMVQNPEVYKIWFGNLGLEIDRRRSQNK